ncbi:Thioredoxin-like protein Clot [Glycine soja]|uniref:Thioredoxin-like protein Clot n=1 Tax=Glycine soja TaxID=3848 RepID=A0A445JEZ8_GLYSO|nr:Thioredoxin-like protein Clot [Glycine soja]
MPLKVLDATVSSFDGVFDKFRSDCVRAEPVIYKKLEASPDDIALLRAYVGDRPTWRNPQHPWRMDPRFKLTGVPTLIRWENNTVKGHLEDHEAHIESKIEALVADK